MKQLVPENRPKPQRKVVSSLPMLVSGRVCRVVCYNLCRFLFCGLCWWLRRACSRLGVTNNTTKISIHIYLEVFQASILVLICQHVLIQRWMKLTEFFLSWGFDGSLDGSTRTSGAPKNQGFCHCLANHAKPNLQMSSDQNPEFSMRILMRHENKDPISANQDFMECQPIQVLVAVALK